MKPLIGRENEIETFTRLLNSERAEFLAVYGRRRVGKTYLIREHFKDKGLYFELVGLKDGTLAEQLALFRDAFQKTFYPGLPIAAPQNWHDAFILLTQEIQKQKSGNIIVFFDELPWLAGPHSGLIQQIDHFWNTAWGQMKNLVLIVCGSAASWMLEKLIHAKGGLHNRITQTLRLPPFTLKETKTFLHHHGCKLNDAQVVELYLAMGGIPYYLQHVQKGKSAAQNIDALCFHPDGALYGEFDKLFVSLFGEAAIYKKLIVEIAVHRYGIAREALLQKLKIKTGGRIHKRLDELEEAGFIASFIPYGKKTDPSYRVIDEYTLFYLYWIRRASGGLLARGHGSYWLKTINTPAGHTWAGYAFESLCYQHIPQIAKALGLSIISYEAATWQTQAKTKASRGAQIDLLFDRGDNATTLCEIKYTNKAFVVDRACAEDWERKKTVFTEHFKNHKNIFFALITNNGVKPSAWAKEVVDAEVGLKDLFG